MTSPLNDIPILHYSESTPPTSHLVPKPCARCSGYYSSCIDGFLYYQYGPDPLDIDTDGPCECECHGDRKASNE